MISIFYIYFILLFNAAIMTKRAIPCSKLTMLFKCIWNLLILGSTILRESVIINPEMEQLKYKVSYLLI